MRKKSFYIVMGIILLNFGLIYFKAVNPEKRLETGGGKIKAVATVFPLMEFAREVIGDRGDVHLLLPAGAEIHSWQPRPSDITKISKTDLFICIGAGLEPWVDDILNSVRSSSVRIFRASEGISLLKSEKHEHEEEIDLDHDHEHDHTPLDPHIWLDFRLDQIIVNRLIATLSELRPEMAADFKSNGYTYIDKLQELDHSFQKSLSNCRQKTFIIGGHAAFGYLAKRYYLNQISLYGLNPESTPTPRKMVNVVRLAKEHNIKMIYYEMNVSDELANVIANEIEARIQVLSSAANLTRRQMQSGVTFFDIMNMNLISLKEGLDCD